MPVVRINWYHLGNTRTHWHTKKKLLQKNGTSLVLRGCILVKTVCMVLKEKIVARFPPQPGRQVFNNDVLNRGTQSNTLVINQSINQFIWHNVVVSPKLQCTHIPEKQEATYVHEHMIYI